MKKKIFSIMLSIVLLLALVSINVEAKSAIYDILSKGSEWILNVDGESGVLKLLGGKGSRTRDGGWEMTSEVDWQGNKGVLKAQADGKNSEQKVILHLKRKNGIKVSCEGFIAQETDKFMSGISRLKARPRDVHGAWYATKRDSKKESNALLDSGRPNLHRGHKPVHSRDRKPDIRKIDKEAPRAYIKIEGILVFTLKDKIKMRANAEDNQKIAKLEIYIDGRRVKSCAAWDCPYSEILTEPGLHRCWAVAEDTSGNRGQSETLEYMVHPTSKPGPSLTLKVQPYHPTSHDRITFSAKAQHSRGVESVTIYVNGREAKTCRSSVCEYTGGPFNDDQVTWRVSAKSKDGGITYGTENTVAITRTASGRGTCSISGKAYGAGAGAASLFYVILYGPGDLNKHVTTVRFDRSGNYRFTGLAKGRYKLVVDSKADTTIGPEPRYRIVQCNGGEVKGMDFEFKK